MGTADGFTLTELMVVVLTMGVLASLASISFRRTRAQREVDALAHSIQVAVHQARQRATTTRSPYLLDVRERSVRFCQVDPATITVGPPANTTQRTCPPDNTALETSALIGAGADVEIGLWAAGAEVRQAQGALCGSVARTAVGSGVPIYFGPSGTADETFASVMAGGLPLSGVSLYLRRAGQDEQGTRRRVVIYGPSAKPRIIRGY